MEEKKKNVLTPIISLIGLALIILLFGTYAWWQTTKKQTNRNLIGSACLKIEFSNETGDINLQDMWPTTDAAGAALTPYTFTISNGCDTPISYAVALESIESTAENPRYLDYDYVKIKFDADAPVTYGSMEEVTSDHPNDYSIRVTKQITMHTLGGHESVTHSLRIWLAENTPMEEINKQFISKIKVTGGQGIEADACYAIRSDGTITEYNPTCGTAAIIPATVNDVRVRNISSDAFKKYNITYNYSLEDVEQDVGKEADFSIYFNNNLIPLFGVDVPQEQQQAALASATVNDIWIVVNHAPLSAEKEAALSNAIVAAFDTLNATPMLAAMNLQPSDFAIYYKGTDALPSEAKGVAETMFEMALSGGNVNSNLLGVRKPATYTKELAINSLDLSQATYLERIEPNAFSNLPDIFTLNSVDLNNVKTGLTSLTFGNNSNPIHIGSGAFVKMDLDSLTLYNSYEYGTMETDGAYGFLGVFGLSTVDNLTILKAGDKTTYEGVGRENALYIAAQPTSTWGEDIGQAFTVAFALGLPAIEADNVVIANGITSVTSSDITTNSLTLPNDLEVAGPYAFIGYNGSSLSLPSTLTTIGEFAFSGYTGNSLTIPNGVTSIGADAFRQYNGSNIFIPHSVKSIGDNAFDSMDSNKTITVDSTEAEMTFLGTKWYGEAHPVFNN